mgnify:CR=1 FL=1
MLTDPNIIIAIFSLMAAALGALVMRELGRGDKMGQRATASSETIAGLMSQLGALRETTRADISRLEADQASCSVSHLALKDTMANNFRSLQDGLDVRLTAQRDATQKLNEAWHGSISSLSLAVARLEATVTGLSAQIQSLTDAERERTRSPQSNDLSITDKLKEFAEFQRLLSKA